MQLRGKDVRFGFVAVTANGQSHYSPINAKTFSLPAQTQHLYLLVMGAPTKHVQLNVPTEERPDPKNNVAVFPYQFKLTTTK